MRNQLLAIGVAALACAGSLPAQGERVSIDAALHTADKPYIAATGEASVSVKPDQAVVEIGVVSQGATAVAAAAQNAQQTDAVLSDLKSLLGGDKKLRTTSYSVRPNYTNPKPGTAAAITGYTATNTVEVTLDDLSRLSKVIDGAMQSGANAVQRLRYQLRNPGAVRAQALRQASEQAKTSVEAIAAGLGLKIVRVMSAEELSAERGSVSYMKAAAPAALGPVPATPIEVGMIDVSATVVLRAEIGQ